MSVKLMGQIWDLDLPHGEAWVLMALADHADHDGNNVYPGLELLSYKTGYSERQLRRILDRLEKRRVILPVSGGAGRGQNQHYKLDFSAAQLKAKKRTKWPDKTDKKSGHFDTGKADILTTNSTQKADILTPEKRTFEAEKADISGFAYKEEPSCEPSCEPSERERRARETDTPFSTNAPGESEQPQINQQAYELYQEFFQKELSIFQQEAFSVVADLGVWEITLRDWVICGYSPRNLPGILRQYQENILRASRFAQNGKGGKHASTSQSASVPDVEFHASRRIG